MTIDFSRLAGAERYAETHTPFLPDGGGVLWIPKELDSGEKVILNEDEDPFLDELLRLMQEPIERD